METITEQPTQEAAAPEQPDPPSVNIQDLQVLRSCIQLASSRGAFKAEEMQTVGTAFNRLNAFLQHVENPQPLTPTESPAAEAPAAEEPTQGE